MKKQKCSTQLCGVQEGKTLLGHNNKIRTVAELNEGKDQGEINRFQVYYLFEGCQNYCKSCSSDSNQRSYIRDKDNQLSGMHL
jgi:hypothetical protein